MHVLIVGNGIAGVTTARHLRRRDPSVRITIVSGESRLHWSRPALMYVYMGHMRFRDTVPYPPTFWATHRIELVHGWVTAVDVDAHTVTVDDTRTLSWDRLVLATGSVPAVPDWPGRDLDRVGGMVRLSDLADLERWTPDIDAAVVVGGGLIGIELAEMLHSRGKRVHLLVREASFADGILAAEEGAIVHDVIRAAGIDLRLRTEVLGIQGRDGAACAVVGSDGDRIEVQYVGVATGVRPHTSVCTGTPIATGRGIRVDDRFRTSAPDVYAVGDCAERVTSFDQAHPGVVESVWYTGRQHGEHLAGVLAGDDAPYDPGVWFNSAKFLHLEHQVYGTVPPARRPDPHVESVLWRDGDRTVRLCHREGVFVGLASLGVRFRHRTCEAWITEARPLDHVLAHLDDAVFDPELTRAVAPGVRAVAS